MKKIIELVALDINNRLFVRMNVYSDQELVPKWTRLLPLYTATTEYIMNIFYDYYLYMPLLLCPKSKLDDCKKWMSRWIARYKHKHSIEGITTWKYELNY